MCSSSWLQSWWSVHTTLASFKPPTLACAIFFSSVLLFLITLLMVHSNIVNFLTTLLLVAPFSSRVPYWTLISASHYCQYLHSIIHLQCAISSRVPYKNSDVGKPVLTVSSFNLQIHMCANLMWRQRSTRVGLISQDLWTTLRVVFCVIVYFFFHLVVLPQDPKWPKLVSIVSILYPSYDYSAQIHDSSLGGKAALVVRVD